MLEMDGGQGGGITDRGLYNASLGEWMETKTDLEDGVERGRRKTVSKAEMTNADLLSISFSCIFISGWTTQRHLDSCS